jgi:hypothetical protein
MRYKFFKFTCVCLMTLVFGMKLASAAPVLLTFDWTGQCDDCQGPNGAIDIPGTNWDDGYTQDVSGLLIMSFDAHAVDLWTALRYVSFNYHGSSILRASAQVVNNDSEKYFWDYQIYDGKIVLPRFDVYGMKLGYNGRWVDLDREGEGSRMKALGISIHTVMGDGQWSAY